MRCRWAISDLPRGAETGGQRPQPICGALDPRMAADDWWCDVDCLSDATPGASAGRNRLPAGAALGYVRVIACRIGAVIPGLGGVGLAIVVAVVWIITPPGICDK